MDVPLPRSVRTRVKRLLTSNALFFATCNTASREPLFRDETALQLLAASFRDTRRYHPFRMQAYVWLPEHFHLLLYVPASTDLSKLMQSAKMHFTLNYKKVRGIHEPTRLWQRSFWDHIIRDEPDFLNHLNYIHLNPVKHGLVQRPWDYPYSSFREYVRRGWYHSDWGTLEGQ